MNDHDYAVMTRNEATFRDLLAGLIARRPNHRVVTEWRVPGRGRADIAVWVGDELVWVIECKVAGYLAGIGQVIGYALRSDAAPVLAVPGHGLPPEIEDACRHARVQLWRVAA